MGMDYGPFIKKHREVGADITVSAVPMDEERAAAFGLMKIDESGRIIDFAEKPEGDALKAMDSLLDEHFPESHDFGGEIIPSAKDMGMHVQAFLHDGYWEDIGTIKAFYDANLNCNDPEKAKFSFYDRGTPIYTQSRFLPPSKLLDANVTRSTIGDGCFIHKSVITNSMIPPL